MESFSFIARQVSCWIRFWERTHQAGRSTNVPPPQNRADLNSLWPSLNHAGAQLPHLHTSSSCNTTNTALFHHLALVTRSSSTKQHREHDCHFTDLQKWTVTSAVNHVHIALRCLCLWMSNCTALKCSFSNCARTKEVCSAWGRHGALTLIKQTGLWGPNVIGHSTDGHGGTRKLLTSKLSGRY